MTIYHKGFAISDCKDDSPYFLIATHPHFPSIYADSISKLKTAIEDFLNDR